MVRLGLLTLAAIGGGMIWLQRGQPVDGVVLLGGGIGATLVVISLWAFALPRQG